MTSRYISSSFLRIRVLSQLIRIPSTSSKKTLFACGARSAWPSPPGRGQRAAWRSRYCVRVSHKVQRFRGKRQDIRSLTGSLSTTTLNGDPVTLALETLGSNQALDLRGLGVLLLALLGNSAADDELADVVLLVETEESANFGGTLGAEALGVDDVGQTRDLRFALLDDAEGENGQVQSSDGTANTLTLALTSATGSVAAVAIAKEQLDTVGNEDCIGYD
jgi:hypothetical protein